LHGELFFRRFGELAIRRAPGARPLPILWLVFSQAMRPVLVGIVLGVAVAIGLTSLLTTMLFGVSATDPLTLPASCSDGRPRLSSLFRPCHQGRMTDDAASG
jgi:ABC-type antimicrobial peptide transport system permease subunit